MSSPYDPSELREIVVRAKKQIRSRMKALRGGYSPAALKVRSAAIVEAIVAHPSLAGARAVASFWPMEGRGEVDLRGLDTALRERGIAVYYPFLDSLAEGRSRTGFREASSVEMLSERGRGFLEPPPEGREAERGDIDVVLVPALAVDARGYRIGYGAGYYDATLGDVCPPATSLLVAFDFQLLGELPHEAHDLACDFVITDKRVLETAVK